uniref:T9SS type A sorting domain-containing protein n=1 Tax=candidate division WOR-3 bacterium TaxID=2052148 RepID=A0A7C4TBW9_UNCW3
MKKLFLMMPFATAAFAVSVTITWNQWPYGAECIGNWFKWWYNGETPVSCPSFNPNDTIWDFKNGSTAATAESYIRPKSEAQGNPPAICTYAERQVLSGSVSWGYEHKDTTGTTQWMWLYGFYASGTQVDYDPPYYKVYQFPMQLGTTWSSNWTWNYLGVDQIYESRNTMVVARGWVRVPLDTTQFFPCLVLETYMSTYDEYGYIDEDYIVHEWVSPIYGSLVTIQSQNHETNPGFTTAKYFFRMKEYYSVNDLFPPTFSNTTIIPSGYYFGPYYVSSTITDPAGISTDSIYYKIGNGTWQKLYHDSVVGNTYHFHIPQISSPDTVRYYLIAKDNSANHNRGTDPQNAPTNHYKFYANDPANDHTPPVIANTTVWTDTAFLGPYPVSANITDSCGIDSAVLYYRFNANPYQIMLPDSVQGSTYYFHIPSATPNTFIRYYLRAVDSSPNHNWAQDPASGYYAFNVEDGEPPQFSNTTVWPDTNYSGPFPVQSTITDYSGISQSYIFFKLGTAGWDSLPCDSVVGDVYYFHIPQVYSSMAIRYYLKAYDASPRHNWATDPANAPNVTYIFYVFVGIEEMTGVNLSEFKIFCKTINPRSIGFSSNERYTLEVYNSLGQKVEIIGDGKGQGDNWINYNSNRLPSGIYFIVLRTEGSVYKREIVVLK